MPGEPEKKKVSCPDCGHEEEKGTRRCSACDYPLGSDNDFLRIKTVRDRDAKGKKKEKSLIDEIFD